MFTTRIHTTIAAAVASLGLVGVAVVPTAAQAATKQGGGSEADKNCEADFKVFEASVNRMEQAQKEGNSAAFSDAKLTAENALTVYENAGCDAILGRVLPPMPRYSIVRPVAAGAVYARL